MAFALNNELKDGNFSLGPSPGFFYSITRGPDRLIKVQTDGVQVNSWTLSRPGIRNDVLELHFDGTFFWTLEALPSDLGLVIKKWRLFPHKTFAFPSPIPIELRWQDELTLIHKPNIRWDSKAFAVQHYHKTFSSSSVRGDSLITLNSVSQLSPGDIIYLGPSTFTGFVGNEESIIVGNVDSDSNSISFSKPGGLENSYLSTDSMDFHKSLYLFNNNSFTGTEDGQGAFIEFELPNHIIIRTDSGKKYGDVGAADFDQTILAWNRSTQIFQLDILNLAFNLQSSLEANMMESNLINVIEMFDMIADLTNNVFLKLQQKETMEDMNTGVFTTVTFPNNTFNFENQTTLPIVNSTSISFPDTRITTSLPAGDSITVVAKIKDQFNFPSSNQSVNFTAVLNTQSNPGNPGTFSSPTVITNTSGISQTTYIPSSTPSGILIDIITTVL